MNNLSRLCLEKNFIPIFFKEIFIFIDKTLLCTIIQYPDVNEIFYYPIYYIIYLNVFH